MSKIVNKTCGENYVCKMDWDDKYNIQCGGDGAFLYEELAISNSKANKICFFEISIKNPELYIRGEGETIEEAEITAWNKFEKYKNCKQHEFEKDMYINGAGICKHCGLFKNDFFKPDTTCIICGKPTSWFKSNKQDWYCRKHVPITPYKELNMAQRRKFNINKRENISTLNAIEKYEFSNYYLRNNPSEVSYLPIFMKEVFNSVLTELNLNKIKDIDISDMYTFCFKLDNLTFDVFRRNHIFVDYIVYKENNVNLIAIRFEEQKDISELKNAGPAFFKTGKYLYVFCIESKYILEVIKSYENALIS